MKSWNWTRNRLLIRKSRLIAQDSNFDRRRRTTRFKYQGRCESWERVCSRGRDVPPVTRFHPTSRSRARCCKDITKRYKKEDLVGIDPEAQCLKIAQGFESQFFVTNDSGKVYEGFVVRESGDDVEFRNVAGLAMTIAKKAEIEERGRRETSMMPLGLADKLNVDQLAAIPGLSGFAEEISRSRCVRSAIQPFGRHWSIPIKIPNLHKTLTTTRVPSLRPTGLNPRAFSTTTVLIVFW